jgi:membrane protein required for colicin V production
MESILGDKTEIDGSYVPILAFALTFAGIVIAIHLLAKILEKVVSLAALGIANKLLGLVFGVLKIALIMSFVLVIVNSLNEKWKFLDGTTWRKESKLYEPVSNLGPMILPVVENNHWYKDYIKDYVDKDDKVKDVEI